MLTIDDLTVRYQTLAGEIEALTSVSLHAETGSTLAVVGESGSGKSTIALAAMGGALMAHDWRDHTIWFERGYGSQG